MSARSIVTFAGITRARARLAEVVAGLREIASGAVRDRAAAKVRDQVEKVAATRLAAHDMTGAAASAMVVDRTGGLVQLHDLPSANGKQWSGKSYVSLQSWWPFRRGMPPFIVGRAIKIYEAELHAALSGQRSPLLVAEEEAEETAAEKSRAAFKREIARIYRQSDEGKAAKRAARKALPR